VTELLTIEQVGERIHTSPRTVQRYIAEGRLRVVRFGKKPLITDRELEAFIAQQESVGRQRRA
jgi:excisionase family DNA binding protein